MISQTVLICQSLQSTFKDLNKNLNISPLILLKPQAIIYAIHILIVYSDNTLLKIKVPKKEVFTVKGFHSDAKEEFFFFFFLGVKSVFKIQRSFHEIERFYLRFFIEPLMPIKKKSLFLIV